MINKNLEIATYILSEDELMEDSINYSIENNLFNKLNQHYETIPGGLCNGCGKCCFESVQTHFIEFINIINHLQQDILLLADIIESVENYYLNDLHLNNSCPMLDNNNRCRIYEARPLVCRLFGHYSQDSHEKNYLETLDTNKTIQTYYKNEFDLTIPEERLNKKVEYCKDFLNEEKISEDKMDKIKLSLLMIDNKFFAEGFIDEDSYNMGLVEWFVYLFLDENLPQKRIDYTKNLLNSDDN